MLELHFGGSTRYETRAFRPTQEPEMSTPQKRKLPRSFAVGDREEDDPNALTCSLQEVKAPPDWAIPTGKFNLKVKDAFDAGEDPAPLLEAIASNETLIYPPTLSTKANEQRTIIIPVYTASSLESVRRTTADVLKKPLGKTIGAKPRTPKIVTKRTPDTVMVSGDCKALKRWLLNEQTLKGYIVDENPKGPRAEFYIPITEDCDAGDITSYLDDLCYSKGFAIEHDTPAYEPCPPSTSNLQELTPSQAYHFADEGNGRATIRDVLTIFKQMGSTEKELKNERIRLMTDMTYYKAWVANFASWVLPYEEPQPIESWPM
jgi:hypothetical protein